MRSEETSHARNVALMLAVFIATLWAMGQTAAAQTYDGQYYINKGTYSTFPPASCGMMTKKYRCNTDGTWGSWTTFTTSSLDFLEAGAYEVWYDYQENWDDIDRLYLYVVVLDLEADSVSEADEEIPGARVDLEGGLRKLLIAV